MAFDPKLADDILHRADIVDVIGNYISVTKKGRNFIALCPFHDDKNPSMHISRDKQIYKCFACGAGGNAISFVQNYEKISYMEAVRKVAEIIGFDDERLRQFRTVEHIDTTLIPLYNALEDLCKYYQYCLLTEEGRKAKDYLNKRGLDDELQKHFRLGYALDDGRASIEFLQKKGHSLKTIETIGVLSGSLENPIDRNRGRVMFPIADASGHIVGFSGRILEKRKDVGKYVNSPETPVFKKGKILFNYSEAKMIARHDGYIYLLEGFMDVFALYRANIKSSVALMGTALTSDHIKMLRQLHAELRICLDGDDAGQMGMLRIAKELENSGLNFRFVDSRGEIRDPDEILTQNGPEKLRQYLNQLVSRASFTLNYLSKNTDKRSLADRKKIVTGMLPILASMNDENEIQDGLLNLSRLTDFTVENLQNLLKKYRNELTDNQLNPKFLHPERDLIRHFSLAERRVLTQMIHDRRAADYYETKIGYFYDEVYHAIANFVLDYYQQHEVIDVANLINDIQSADLINSNELVNEFSDICLQGTVPAYSEEAMDELRSAIVVEREEDIFNQRLNQDLTGKNPAEQAAIMARYYKEKTAKKPITKIDDLQKK